MYNNDSILTDISVLMETAKRTARADCCNCCDGYVWYWNDQEWSIYWTINLQL